MINLYIHVQLKKRVYLRNMGNNIVHESNEIKLTSELTNISKPSTQILLPLHSSLSGLQWSVTEEALTLFLAVEDFVLKRSERERGKSMKCFFYLPFSLSYISSQLETDLESHSGERIPPCSAEVSPRSHIHSTLHSSV